MLIAIVVGFLSSLILRKDITLSDETPIGSCGHDHHHDHDHHARKGGKAELVKHIIGHTWEEFLDVGTYFVLGIFIAAVFRTFLNIQAISGFIENVFSSSVFMMIAAFALNLCSEADAFVGASFSKIVPGAAVFAFLLYGPMMDIKLLAMYQTIFKKKTSIFLFITVSLLTITTVLLLNSFNILHWFEL